MGKSDKQKASDQLYRDIGRQNVNVANPFDNYQDQFSYDDIAQSLEEYFNEARGNLQSQIQTGVARAGGGAASRLASQGIKGSMYNDSIASAQDSASRQGLDALSSLEEANMGQRIGLKQTANDRKLNLARLRYGVDSDNISRMFQKYGMQGSAIQGLDDNTWFDDALAVVNTGANVVSAFKSDRRAKEDIKLVGNSNGFNIYEYRYIGNPKKYRGVMAQDVEAIIPGAVIEINDVKYVNYTALGLNFFDMQR